MRRTSHIIGAPVVAILLGGAIIGCGSARPPAGAAVAPLPVTQLGTSRGCSMQFLRIPVNGVPDGGGTSSVPPGLRRLGRVVKIDLCARNVFRYVPRPPVGLVPQPPVRLLPTAPLTPSPAKWERPVP